MNLEEEVIKGDIKEVASLFSITKKVKAEELKIKQEIKKVKLECEQLSLELDLKRKEAEAKSRDSQKELATFQLYMLVNTMSITIGNGESFAVQRVFTENELAPYKLKALELLKKI